MTFITLGFKNNVITDGTFITLGFKMLLRMGLLLRLGPNVITDGTFITLGSSYYTCAFNKVPFNKSSPLSAIIDLFTDTAAN